jgi:hypothetical protein
MLNLALFYFFEITDDSELALSLARSLVANKKYDKFDVACSYAFWVQSDPPDIGITTLNALKISEVKIDLTSRVGGKIL